MEMENAIENIMNKDKKRGRKKEGEFVDRSEKIREI